MRFLAQLVFLLLGLLAVTGKPLSDDCLRSISLGLPCDQNAEAPDTAADTYEVPQVLLDPITFEPLVG